jgi:hypothetical protein
MDYEGMAHGPFFQSQEDSLAVFQAGIARPVLLGEEQVVAAGWID